MFQNVKFTGSRLQIFVVIDKITAGNEPENSFAAVAYAREGAWVKVTAKTKAPRPLTHKELLERRLREISRDQLCAVVCEMVLGRNRRGFF